MTMVLNKALILAAKDLKSELVDVPEWGEDGKILIGELPAADRLRFAEYTGSEEVKDKHFLTIALPWFIIDEEGNRIFDEDDTESLGGKSLEVLKRLYEAVKRVNVMGEAVEEEIKK